MGLRRILNFGHTVRPRLGGALPLQNASRRSGGDRVSLRKAAPQPSARFLDDKEVFSRIKTLFRKFPFSFRLPIPCLKAADTMRCRSTATERKARATPVCPDRQDRPPLPFDGEYCRTVPAGRNREGSIQEELCLNT